MRSPSQSREIQHPYAEVVQYARDKPWLAICPEWWMHVSWPGIYQKK